MHLQSLTPIWASRRVLVLAKMKTKQSNKQNNLKVNDLFRKVDVQEEDGGKESKIYFVGSNLSF